MGKQRIHLSVSDSILEKLDHIAVARDFSDRVALFEQLVREEWERRHGPSIILRDAPSPGEHAAAATIQHAAAAAQGTPVSYRAGKAKRAKTAQSPQS